MPVLWIEDSPGAWAIRQLTAPRDALGARAAQGAPAPALVHCESASARGWHLLAPLTEHVWLNGLPLVAGIRALCDRDEIRSSDGTSFFYSVEELAQVTPLPSAETQMMCPRCRQQIEQGTDAVLCPQCHLWHHQSVVLPCWTYAATCAMCPQPSALDAGYQWTPMEL